MYAPTHQSPQRPFRGVGALGSGPIADSPPTVLRPFAGPADTVREMARMVRGDRGERSTLVRSLKDHIVRDLQPKDYLSELLAIRNFAAEKIRYSNDALAVEQVQDPERIADQIVRHGRAVGDCFTEGTLLLAEGFRLVPVEHILPGTRIWGYDKWVTVEAVVPKGTLSVDAIRLNNGSTLRLTPDHHVYVGRCPRHSYDCACAYSERVEERIRVSELEENMVLPVPDRLPFGSDDSDPEARLLDALYVADGWHEEYRFSISGQDGKPKEEQKRLVQEIAENRGIASRWHRKYISINDRELAQRMALMGSHAPDKRLLSLDLGEASVAQTLRGLMVDSSKNTHGPNRTLTTTSRMLAVQARVLHRMMGISCGYRFIQDHGGLGDNPIYRLNPRSQRTADGRREKLLRVKSIYRDVGEQRCWDLQTEDHRVYLPEHDVTVSQCDDIATFIATLARQLGREADFVIVGFGAKGHYSHVFARAKEPRSKQWIVLDPVAGTNEAGMLRKVTTYQIWKID